MAGVIALVLQNSSAASPADMSRLLVDSASAGQLSEVPGSGFASLAASASPDLLLQNIVAAPVVVTPASLPPIDSPSAGPFTFTVALSQQPTAAVQMALSVGEYRAHSLGPCPSQSRRRGAACCPSLPARSVVDDGSGAHGRPTGPDAHRRLALLPLLPCRRRPRQPAAQRAAVQPHELGQPTDGDAVRQVLSAAGRPAIPCPPANERPVL